MAFLTTLWPAILSSLANGDAADGFIYNTAVAAGLQLYPEGLAKYEDMYSWDGYFMYVGDWFNNWI